MRTRIAAVLALLVVSLVAAAAASAAPPANDSYATPTVLPVGGGAVTSTIDDASKESGESSVGKGVDNDWLWTTWYAWELPAAALAKTAVRVDLCGADVASEPEPTNTKVSVLLAADGINGTAFAAAASGCPQRPGGLANVARFTFEATPGAAYRFPVGAPFTPTGDVTFALRPAPFATSTATLSGAPTPGSGLVVTAPTWNAVDTGSVAGPTWQECNEDGVTCREIYGAYGNGYLVRTSDVGRRIRVVYTATNDIGSAVVVSAATPPISATPPPPPAKLDTDADGTPDEIDTDDDNDKLLDTVEGPIAFDPLKADTDGDGIPDATEACTSFGICPGRAKVPSIVIVPATPKTVVTGTKGDDLIFAGSNVSGVGGVVGTPKLVTCNGLVGNDTCIGSLLRDLCLAGAGNDTCVGNAGNDTCSSTAGKDSCSGGAGLDTCLLKTVMSMRDVENGTLKAAPPRSTCDGGAGADTCSMSVSMPSDPVLAAIDRIARSAMPAVCNGGTGNDVCKVAPRTSSAITGVATTLVCNGQAGNDSCVAQGATTWAQPGAASAVTSAVNAIIGVTSGAARAAAPKAVTHCDGGAGDDFLVLLNGIQGDTATGGPGSDICLVDPQDVVKGCETTVVVANVQELVNALQLARTKEQQARALAQVEAYVNKVQVSAGDKRDQLEKMLQQMSRISEISQQHLTTMQKVLGGLG